MIALPLDAVNDLLPQMPLGPLTNLLLRPLIVPLALACLVIGFVLWRFMGDLPGVLGMGLQILLEAVRPSGPEAGPAPRPEPPPVDPVTAGLLAIRDRDRSFDREVFLAQVPQFAGPVVKSWIDHDLGPCRPLMADDCWQLQNAQMKRGRAEGWRAVAGGIGVQGVTIVGAASDETGDRVTVRLRLVPSANTTKVIRGRRVSEWLEDWLFCRAAPPPAAGQDPAVVQVRPWQLQRMNHVAIHLAA